MEIEFKLEDFEGPLDLLLHLVKTSKMDIFNLKLEIIADQYLAYIQKMEDMNLNIASSYLIMASELMEIKSRLLLPRHEEEVEEEESPEENLVRRLVEYQRYKDLTENFKALEEARKQIYTKTPANIKEYLEDPKLINSDNVSVNDLLIAFKKMLDRQEVSKPVTTKVTRKELSVEERSKSIKKILSEKKKVNFLDLFESLTKEYVVVTFLAILELAKQKELKITQENTFGNIICEVSE